MKKLSFFLMAMLISLVSFAQDAPVYELYPVAGSNNGYAGNCDVTVNGIKWNLTGNSTMDPWRIGGKSITNQDRALYSKTPLAYNIDKIEVTHGTANSITVNSFKLIISDEANGAGETIDVAFKANATTTIDLPEGDYTDKYFKFLYNVTVSGTSNKFVQFVGAKFYAALAEDAVKAPIIKGAEDFISETEVTIEAEDDVTVYYTLDDTEPTTASTVYAAPFTVKETTTVKAVAYRGETASFVTSATFTQATRVTAAEAAQLAMKVASNNALTPVTYVINAYVTSVIDQTLSSGQQRFWVADTKDGGQVLQSYYCNVPQVLKVGDYIQMFGKLTKYNTSPQMKNGQVTIIPECSLATPVNWDAPIAAEANTDQWYAVNVASAIAAGKDLALTVTNPGTEAVEITLEAYANCPATELIVKSTKTFNAGETKTTTVKYDEYLADQVEVVYLHVVTSGDLTIGTEAIEPCSKATAINWNDPIAAAANLDAWYAVNVESAIAAGKDLALTVSNPSTEAVEVSIEAYANCPATELIVKSTSTINAGASKTTTVKYDEYLADQVKVVYMHVTTKGGEIKVEAAPATETVYFINNKGWSKVNAYAWEPENAGWPGVAATKEAEQIGGYDVYSYTADAGKYANVIFNNGSGQQTADLKWTAGKYVINNQWYTKEEAEAQLVKPVEYESVYFVDNQGWGKANIYTWSPEVGTWPGVAMKKEAEQLAGYDVYSYTVEKGTSFGGVIFNNGSSQTGDLQWTAGKYYVKDGWYTKEEAEAKLAGPVTPPVITYVLMGVKGDWTTGIAMTVNPDNENEYVLLGQEILEGDAVKVVTLTDGVATAWCGNVDEYSVERSYDENGNIVLAPGKYDFYYKVAEDLIYIGGEAYKPIEWIPMELEITNLTTSEIPVGDQTVLQLMGRNDMMDADVMLFLNNYTGEEKAYEVNAESSLVTYGGLELTVMDGSITKSVDPEKGDVFAGTVHASVVDEEMGEMYVEFALTMYAIPPIAIELEDVEIVVNEESAIAFFNATWEGAPLQVEVSGFEEVEFKEYPECWLSIGDDVNWVDAAAGPAAVIIEDGVAMLEGEFTSFSSGKTYEVMLSGKLPVKEEPVVEPTYTENKLNTFAFGLESELTEEALNVTYRLNNSNATSVNVLVYKGEKLVATVAGTTTIGKNTVAIPVANLPKGRMLTWSVEVNGTSVAAPTQEEKIYSFYHPSGLDIDNNPENPTFGMLLINEGMHSVKDIASGYVSSGFGAGIFAFTPSLDLIPNGDQPGYNGGVEFTTGRADGAGTAYSPRRIRISEDGRIFVTSLNTDGNYLWEVNPANMNEWTSVFQGTLNENKELLDAEGNFVAAPNNGFDVKGAGENLQLAMYSVNLPGITGAAMSGFRCDEYNLGTATSWATAPSKNWVLGKYAINYTGTQVVYDNEGGIWIASYRGTANEANPGLVHINAQGVEDAKLIWSNLRQAGIRFNNDFTKLVVAGNNGAAKKATIYSISKDAIGAPVLDEEAVIDMASVGNNLNDFAFDYAGNLYACGNSAEKLIGWAMPYSGQVVTPAASKYAFHIGELLPDPVVITEMAGVVKRALQNGENTIVLTHETDGTPHIYEVANGTILELVQHGVIAVDPENAGDYLAISDIALTEDGKLVATNYMQTQSGDDYVDAGLKRGETRIYIWNDLHDVPSILFTSKMSSNWFRSKQGLTMAVKGTSDNMEIFMTGIHATKAWARVSSYRVINGVYEEPAINNNDYYHFYDVADAVALETTVGTQYELTASPLGAMNWILDAELINPVEIVEPETNNVEISSCVALSTDLGKKYNGTSIVTVGEQVLMVAPYATAEGLLAGVKVLDITAGLDAATEVATADLDAAVEATAAATAVAVAENTLTITLVADATIYTLNVELESEPNYMTFEDEITNLVIDLESMAIIGGPSTMWQVEVYLGLGQDNGDGTFTLTEESSVAIMGFDARFIDGYVYDIDVNAPAAKAVLHVEDSGFFYEFKLNMTNTPQEAIVVVVEDATVQIDTIPLFGDMVDYALKMTANWTYAEDGVTYPVLVEVPVYYPEATEPSEIQCTVTIGGMGDTDPWLGFGEGPLTITTVDGVVTAKGIIANPYTGVAFDVTVSGKLPQGPGLGLDNININVKPVKMIKNGMLIINKGGREFNAQGAILK